METRDSTAYWQSEPGPAREEVIVEEMGQHLADHYEVLSGGATETEAYRRTLAELQSSEISGLN